MSQQNRMIRKDLYTYQALVASLANGVTATTTFNIETDANFIWTKTAMFADIAGAVQTDSSRVLPLVTIAITDTGSGRNLQSNPVPLPAIAGDGRLPFVLPAPREFKANSGIQVTLSNYSNATTYDNLYVLFIGYKQFVFSG